LRSGCGAGGEADPAAREWEEWLRSGCGAGGEADPAAREREGWFGRLRSGVTWGSDSFLHPWENDFNTHKVKIYLYLTQTDDMKIEDKMELHYPFRRLKKEK
jgi:hypothetical protein